MTRLYEINFENTIKSEIMLLDIFHQNALPPDKIRIGESSQGNVDVREVVGGRVGNVGLTLSDINPIVENII